MRSAEGVANITLIEYFNSRIFFRFEPISEGFNHSPLMNPQVQAPEFTIDAADAKQGDYQCRSQLKAMIYSSFSISVRAKSRYSCRLSEVVIGFTHKPGVSLGLELCCIITD